MSAIVIVDTSVLLNILNVPGRNERRVEVLAELGGLIETGDHLFIPMAAIVEVGNHIAQLGNGAQQAGHGRAIRCRSQEGPCG